MNRRELRQVEAKRIAGEKQEAERLRLQEEAELITTVGASPRICCLHCRH